MPAIYRPEGIYNPSRVDAEVLYLEPKLDGQFFRLIVNSPQDVCAHGHTVSTTTGEYTYLPEALAQRLNGDLGLLPKGTIVEGELVWPEHEAAEVITAIKQFPHKLRFMPFTCPMWAGEDLSAKLYLQGRARVGSNFPLPDCYVAQPKPSLEQLAAIHHHYWPAAEGIVLKQYWYANWWKWKPVQTVDLVVMGFTVGTAGKWDRRPNAMVLATGAGTPAGRCGNMNDVARCEIPQHVGEVVEVAFDKITVDNKLRFPRFVRWRPDKEANECKELCEQI